tara:strand:- start:4594 stop:6441 length:1848 start_codon:yes stop_codon:yes gene_type:complete
MINYVSNLKRFYKQLIVLFIDIIICFFSLYLAYYLRLESFIHLNENNIRFFLLAFFIFIPIFILLGLYNSIFRYYGFATYLRVLYAIILYSIILFIAASFLKIENIPRSSVLIQAPIFLLFIVFFRLLISFIFRKKNNVNKSKDISLYGCGDELFDYINLLKNHFNIRVVIDDDSKNIGKKYDIFKIISSANIISDLKKAEVYKIFITSEIQDRYTKEEILNIFSNEDVIVKFLPKIEQLQENPYFLYSINKINFEDIIKSKITYDYNIDIYKKFYNKNILVTGAGGSIGQQLCKELINYNLNTLLILDNSEFNLYTILEDLKSKNLAIKIIPLLVSVADYETLRKKLSIIKIDYSFHSAAYKHVPLLEDNINEAIKNNILGTFNIAKLSHELKISNSLLISTDKAVRPTNIMGATKRISENIFQSFDNQFSNINYSIVRFGNVVNSRGSVLPQFANQIENRLPIRLTHNDVERYFMTIPDAAKLIIEIINLKLEKKLSSIYFLDMGKPMKILDIIKKMLKLNGLSLKKDLKDQNGDIKLEIIGLRPGEKIKEELSLNLKLNKLQNNKMIFTCDENYLNYDVLINVVDSFKDALKNDDEEKSIKLLKENVESFGN